MTNPADWDALGHQAEERGDLAEHFRCHLTAWVLRLKDERWHGTQMCDCVGHVKIAGGEIVPVRRWSECSECRSTGHQPTFALLLDHPGTEPCERCEDGHIQCSACAGMGETYEIKGTFLQRQRHNRSSKKPRFDQPRMRKCGRCSGSRQEQCDVCHGTGKATVRGHVGEFVDWLRHVWGQVELAEKVGQLGIEKGDFGFFGFVPEDRAGFLLTGLNPADIPMEERTVHNQTRFVHRTYTDAARELIRRVVAVVTEECPGSVPPISTEICKLCSGLGWRAVGLKEVGR